jgi:hypothetical protein
MAKRSRKKPSSPTDWVKLLDTDAITAAWDEATVDAYDEEEQLGSIMNAIENELLFPFAAKVMGLDVSVVGAEQPKVGRGLDLIVELDGQQHRIEARSVELLPPLPAGAEFLAAYVTND